MEKNDKSRIKTLMILVIIPIITSIIANLISAPIVNSSPVCPVISPTAEPVHTPEGSKTDKYIFKVIIEKNTEFVKPENKAKD